MPLNALSSQQKFPQIETKWHYTTAPIRNRSNKPDLRLALRAWEIPRSKRPRVVSFADIAVQEETVPWRILRSFLDDHSEEIARGFAPQEIGTGCALVDYLHISHT